MCCLTFVVTIQEGFLVCVGFHYFSNLIFITLQIYKGLNQLLFLREYSYIKIISALVGLIFCKE